MTNPTSHSPAAKAYARERIPIGNVAIVAMDAFDAGAASVAPPTPQKPAWITTDDPRWRDGAKVRGEFRDGSAVEGTLEMSAAESGDHSGGWWIVYLLECSTWVTEFTTVYLLAEAPDPDVETLAVLGDIAEWSLPKPVAGESDGQYWSRSVLAALRTKGYDVTKRGVLS